MAASEKALFSPLFLITTSALFCCAQDEAGVDDWLFDADSIISIFISLSFFVAKFALHAGTVVEGFTSSFCSSMLGRFEAGVVNLFAKDDEGVCVALIDGDLLMDEVEEGDMTGLTDEGCVKEECARTGLLRPVAEPVGVLLRLD